MEKKAMIYVGGGFLPGVPARDLSAEEVKFHGGEKALLESGLYKKPQAEEKAAKKE